MNQSSTKIRIRQVRRRFGVLFTTLACTFMTAGAETPRVRILGPQELTYMACRFDAATAGSITSLSLDTEAGAEFEKILLCSSTANGLPDLDTAVQLVGEVQHSQAGDFSPDVSTNAEVQVGAYWILLAVTPDGQPRQGPAVGYRSAAGARAIALGTSSGDWAMVPDHEILLEVGVQSGSGPAGKTAQDARERDGAGDESSTIFHGASPNPTHTHTVFEFSLARAGDVTIMIFDVRGRVVRTLGPRHQVPGAGRVHFDGRDGEGRPIASGVYFAHIVGPQLDTQTRILWLR